LPLELDVVIFF